MFITPKRRSPRAHAQNTRTSITDTQCPYARTHICAPGTLPVQPSKGSISGEKGWGAVWASGLGTWHDQQGTAATLQAGKDFPRNILPAPINTIISVRAPAQKKPKLKKEKEPALSRGVAVAGLLHETSNNSVVTRSDRCFVKGVRGSVAGQC